MTKTILVTGGAGFIGSALVRYLINETSYHVINYDKLTYAGNLQSLVSIEKSERYSFVHGDICDSELFSDTLEKFQPDWIMHLAAESHVDRSIDGPGDFIQTNIVGTYSILDQARKYLDNMEKREKREGFRFLHVSTDEVYGDLEDTGFFVETTPYQPSSPYSASKAASDHLARAWQRTFDLPVIVTNCSNNYGPFHFPEKLIPLMILNALDGKPLPVYGDGQQVRDWLFVEDHVRALCRVLEKGQPGETYNIGGFNEKKNLEVVQTICELLNKMVTDKPEGVSDFISLITYVEDRPGHDNRYAIDASKINKELNWSPLETFDSGIEKTVRWYLDNLSWCKAVQDGSYNRERIGLK